MKTLTNKIVLLVAIALFPFFSCEDKKKDSLVFIGDSLISSWNVASFFPSYIVKNKGVSGARLEDIRNWDIDAQNKTAIFLIGTNDLGSIHSVPDDYYDQFAESYLDIITSINRSEERRVGKECRSRWSPYH